MSNFISMTEQVTMSPLWKNVTKVVVSTKADSGHLWALRKYDIQAKVTQKDWQ